MAIKVKETNWRAEINDHNIKAFDKFLNRSFLESTSLTPFDTGATEESTFKYMQVTSTKISGAIGVNTDYAKYPYYGTKNMPPGGKTGVGQWLEVAVLKNVDDFNNDLRL